MKFLAHTFIPFEIVIIQNMVDNLFIRLTVFKVDFEKTYESVKWEFLFYMLRRMEFCDKWIQWVNACLKSTSFLVLVNGIPNDEFVLEKGLRQRNPMAPFLFLIVAEGLNGLVKQAICAKCFSGFRLGLNDALEISILQFADDTLLFGD